MLGRARNFFFGSSAAPEGPPEAPPEAKKRRGGAAPLALLRLPDDALVSACAYLGLVDGARAAVTCRRLAAIGRNVHPSVLIMHRPLLWWGRPALTLILDSHPGVLQRDTTDDLRLALTTEQRELEQRIRDLERSCSWRFCADCPGDDLDVTYVRPVVIGGQLCSVTFPHRSERGGELQLPPMHVYSLKKNAWRTIDHFAHLGALTSFACCALGSELCFVGGTPLDTDDPSAISAARVSVRTLNLQSGAWTQLADMPIGVESELLSCACCGKLYVLGNRVGEWGAPVLQIYDPARCAWTRGPDCQARGWCLDMRSAGSHIFCMWSPVQVEFEPELDLVTAVFDTETCTWSECVGSTHASHPGPESCCFTIHQEALINIVMWTNGTVKFFELERVGPSTWAWREVSPPFPVEGLLADHLHPGDVPYAGFAYLRA